jgi:hypothetical protein
MVKCRAGMQTSGGHVIQVPIYCISVVYSFVELDANFTNNFYWLKVVVNVSFPNIHADTTTTQLPLLLLQIADPLNKNSFVAMNV